MYCATCRNNDCYTKGKDCGWLPPDAYQAYDDEATLSVSRAATFLEAEYYMKKTRLEELIEFARIQGYRKIGIAFCVGLSSEVRILNKILTKHGFTVVPVVCKTGGRAKEDYGLPKINPDRYEAMCNPVGQAAIMNEEKTDLNVIVGLCIGHDILFTQNSKAPVTTFAVKDRVLGHNPLAAIYSGYYLKKRFGIEA